MSETAIFIGGPEHGKLRELIGDNYYGVEYVIEQVPPVVRDIGRGDEMIEIKHHAYHRLYGRQVSAAINKMGSAIPYLHESLRVDSPTAARR